jgi:hypothetical protein
MNALALTHIWRRCRKRGDVPLLTHPENVQLAVGGHAVHIGEDRRRRIRGMR